MRRFRTAVGWRVALVLGLMIPSGLMVMAGPQTAASAAPSPLSCNGFTTALPGTTVIGDCFMGYAAIDQWFDRPIPVVGGTQPYTVTLVSGYLPSGLALEPDGSIQGYPIIPQDSTFTVAVKDSSSPQETLTTTVGLWVYAATVTPTAGPQAAAIGNLLLPDTQSLGPLAVQIHQNGSGGGTNPVVLELEQLALNAVNDVVCNVVAPIVETVMPGPGCIR